MKGCPLFLPMAFLTYVTAAELSGNETGMGVETRRAEAMGKPMEKFRTLEGKIYREVVITKIDAGGVSFTHADGVARLRHDDLSPGQRKYFGIDLETAAEMYRNEAAQRAAYEKKVAVREEERRVEAQQEAADLKEMRRLEAEIAASLASISEADGTADDVEKIPAIPTIRRVDTPFRNTRRYGSYGRSNSNYGYGYSAYIPTYHHRHVNYGSGFRGGYRYGGHGGYGARIVIRR